LGITESASTNIDAAIERILLFFMETPSFLGWALPARLRRLLKTILWHKSIRVNEAKMSCC
jgi:hypothetical protein